MAESFQHFDLSDGSYQQNKRPLSEQYYQDHYPYQMHGQHYYQPALQPHIPFAHYPVPPIGFSGPGPPHSFHPTVMQPHFHQRSSQHEYQMSYPQHSSNASIPYSTLGNRKPGYNKGRQQRTQDFKFLARKKFHLPSTAELQAKSDLLKEPLTCQTYKERFHVLLYWEEQEHERILRDKCNGSYFVESFNNDDWECLPDYINIDSYLDVIAISGMTEDQADYAKQAATQVTIISGDKKVMGDIIHVDYYICGDPVMMIGIKEDTFKFHFDSNMDNVSSNAVIRFKLKHSYFENLHRSIECLQMPVINRLLPTPNNLVEYSRKERLRRPEAPQFQLDFDYQFEALKRILFCSPNSPFLVTGPFGTGKTRMLATAAYMFLKGEGKPLPDFKKRRVLIACHHLQTSDSYLENYFGPNLQCLPGIRIIRLLQNRGTYHYRGQYRQCLGSIMELKGEVKKYDLIITTLLTSLSLFNHCEIEPGFFSHILIDEAAQTREPEIAAVISLSDEHTKVVLAGDHLQVGPDTLVLGKVAREHGLSESLLKRLHSLYHLPSFRDKAELYTAKLLTNYRCHPSLLQLPSDLFYNSTLEPHSKIHLHPHTKGALLFKCTSLEQGNSCTLSKEDQLIAEAKKEANEVLQMVLKFCLNWPAEWERKDLKRVCVLAPSRLQQRIIRDIFMKKAKQKQFIELRKIHITVAFDIQGREYRAVFLCTSEPVLSDGSTANPTKSICDKFVFNTVITRAQSLVVAVGNPFRLFEIEDKLPNKGYGCWKAFLKHCIALKTLEASDKALNDISFTFPMLLKKLRQITLSSSECLVDKDDSILQCYSEEQKKGKIPSHAKTDGTPKKSLVSGTAKFVQKMPNQSFSQHWPTKAPEPVHQPAKVQVGKSVENRPAYKHSSLSGYQSERPLAAPTQKPSLPISSSQLDLNEVKEVQSPHVLTVTTKGNSLETNTTPGHLRGFPLGAQPNLEKSEVIRKLKQNSEATSRRQILQVPVSEATKPNFSKEEFPELSRENQKKTMTPTTQGKLAATKPGRYSIPIQSKLKPQTAHKEKKSKKKRPKPLDEMEYPLSKPPSKPSNNLVTLSQPYIAEKEMDKISDASILITKKKASSSFHPSEDDHLASDNFELPSKMKLLKREIDLVTQLSRTSYKDKFHMLLYWEEHAHVKALQERHNSEYEFSEYTGDLKRKRNDCINYAVLLAIHGMTEDDIDNAKQASEGLEVIFPERAFEGDILFKIYDKNAIHLIVGLFSRPKKIPNKKLSGKIQNRNTFWAKVKFHLKHSYFKNLHRAVSNLSETVIKKLIPDYIQFKDFSLEPYLKRPRLDIFSMDKEYQFHTLKMALLSSPSAPFLVSGPFGTGKTRMLATAAFTILKGGGHKMGRKPRVLLATHHLQTADSYIDQYFGPAVSEGELYASRIVRLISTKDYIYNGHYIGFFTTAKEISNVLSIDLFIATLLTVPHLLNKRGTGPGFFTHILIDEAAQVREPEAAAAFAFADENTKIILAGDHMQVGPETLVLGDKARENGLGVSILQRLHSLYKSDKYCRVAQKYSAQMLTNYRCHPGILRLPSHLFYQSTLEGRSESLLHPKTSQPIHFICTSLDATGETCTLSNEDDLKKQCQKEAVQILDTILSYGLPKCWNTKSAVSGKQMTNVSWSDIAVVLPSRMQERIIKGLLHHNGKYTAISGITLQVAFDIQGREFRAVFLCTSEPLRSDGSTVNPTKSICDKFVFNTVITRAQSLVVAVGNPFRLLKIEDNLPNGNGCWKAFLRHCLQCKSFSLSKIIDRDSVSPSLLSLQKMVFKDPSEFLLNNINLQDSGDSVLQAYNEALHKKKHIKRAAVALRTVKGDRGWTLWEESCETKVPQIKNEVIPKTSADSLVRCQLEQKSSRLCIGKPLDPNQKEIHIRGVSNRKCAFEGATVDIEVFHEDSTGRYCYGKVVKVVEQGDAKQFICTVDKYNTIFFFPIDKKSPKIVNLPQLSRSLIELEVPYIERLIAEGMESKRHDVICFDPASVTENQIPKVQECIPLDIAVNMLFVVQPLKWNNKYRFPLGVVIGVLPRGETMYSAERILQIQYQITESGDSFQNLEALQPNLPPIESNLRKWSDCLTIDPLGAINLDDALSLELIEETNREDVILEFAVHIVNAGRMLSKDSTVDDCLLSRCTSVYGRCQGEFRYTPMLPENITEQLSLNAKQERQTITVSSKVILRKQGLHFDSPLVYILRDTTTIEESLVTTNVALTYLQAESLLNSKIDNPNIKEEVAEKEQQFNAALSENAYPLVDQLKILFRIAKQLRIDRLGEAGHAYVPSDSTSLSSPISHMLVEEMMIWANSQVAYRLVRSPLPSILLRVQAKSNVEEEDNFFAEFSRYLGNSLIYAGIQKKIKNTAVTDNEKSAGFMLRNETKEQLMEYLLNEDPQGALKIFCSEHIHPQLAVMKHHHAVIKSRASYKAVEEHIHISERLSSELDNELSHSDLNVLYTHFSSPLRRAPDVIVQRLLLEAIDYKTQFSYDSVRLKELATRFNYKSANAARYQTALTVLDVAIYTNRSSVCVTAFVSKVTTSKIEICLEDLDLKKIPPRQRKLKSSLFLPRVPESHSEGFTMDTCREWNVLVASMSDEKQILNNQLYHENVKECSRRQSLFVNKDTLITVFHNIPTENTFMNRYFLASIRSPCIIIPAEKWSLVKEFTKEPCPENSARVLEMLRKTDQVSTENEKLWHIDRGSDSEEDFTSSLSNFEAESSESTSDKFGDTNSTTSLSQSDEDDFKCNIKLSDSLANHVIAFLKVPTNIQQFDPLRVWLTRDPREYILTPTIQLVEVAPHVNLCVQHLNSPALCFSTDTVTPASKKQYESREEYIHLWENVLLPEAAVASFQSIKENSRIVMLRNVYIQWPKMEIKSHAIEEPYYLPSGNVIAVLPASMKKDILPFVNFEVGSLLCVRYDIKLTPIEKEVLRSLAMQKKLITQEDDRDLAVEKLLGPHNDGSVRTVFHMVLERVNTHVDIEDADIKLELKFLGGRFQNISEVLNKLLRFGKYTCEIEITNMSISHRRIYKSLLELKTNSEPLINNTFLSNIPTSKYLGVQSPIQFERFSKDFPLVTQLWETPSTTLNCKQTIAVQLAMNNPVQLIQGPPGTGKSVTGAHIAYAFAMLNKARKHPPKQNGKLPCVLYCGPSNKSVEVVLRMLIHVKGSLKILRIYGRAVEDNDYPPLMDSKISGKPKSNHTCAKDLQEFALHHKIRIESSKNLQIINLEKRLKQLKEKGHIPGWEMRKEFNSLIEQAEIEIIRRGYDVILCTCSEAGSKRIRENLIPLQCIIDEAAMATEPECMVPISISKHVVLIGDHQQLQPIIEHRESKENGLECSLFERLAKSGATTPLLLETQYRMNTSVCWFPSKHFYEENLKPHDSLKYRSLPNLKHFWPIEKRQIAFCHVEDEANQEIQDKFGTESKSNNVEANKVIDILKTLIRKHKTQADEIAVLTPYKDQKHKILTLLDKDRHLSTLNIPVQTITESQGSEFGLVILSTVRSLPVNDIYDEEAVQADRHWVLENLGFITDPHQICVGITRSKYGLIIVGNKVLLNYDKETWSHLLAHYEKNNCIVDGKQFPAKSR